MEAYPNAKIILSVRDDSETWYKSITNTLEPYLRVIYMEPGLSGMIRRVFQRSRGSLGTFEAKMIHHTYYRDVYGLGMEKYESHNAWIRQMARDQNREFLEFNVKQGWEPLCRFLKKDIPDTAFPRGNDTKEMQAIVAGILQDRDGAITSNLLKLSAIVTAGAAVGGWWLSYRGRR